MHSPLQEVREKMPTLGRVQVLRSTAESQSALSEAVGKGAAMALSPSDTLIVYSKKSLSSRDSVSVTGAVMSPGVYPYYVGMTVKDLILLGVDFALIVSGERCGWSDALPIRERLKFKI